MNKIQKLTAVALVAAAVAAWLKFAPNKEAQYFAEKYPHLDPKVLADAHSKLMGLAFRGKLDMANWSEEKYNDLLLDTYNKMTNK